MKIYGEHFCGNKISDYGLQNGYIDYACFAKAFDAVLCNSIWEIRDESMYDNMVNEYYEYYVDENENEISIDEWENLPEDEQDNYNYREDYAEVFQWYIVSDNAKWLLDEAEEVYTYSEVLDCYIWGVTHLGTAWDYVLTDIKIERED